MIIVKTKNGDRFINDKAVTMVEHDREKAVVDAYGDNGVFFHIEDVESVIYTNDAQPTSWKDEGSEIQRLKKANAELSEWGGRMRDEYLKMEQERDELKARVAQLEPKADPSEQLSPEMKALLSQNVEELDMSVRTRNLLKANGIETVRDLCRLKKTDWLKFRNGGKMSLKELDDFLMIHNLTWKMDV